MEVRLQGLDLYEVEAIQFDGTNSDEICQFMMEHEPETEIDGALIHRGQNKKLMVTVVFRSGETMSIENKEWLAYNETPYGNQSHFFVMSDDERKNRFKVEEE